jgi:hypothetical protein
VIGKKTRQKSYAYLPFSKRLTIKRLFSLLFAKRIIAKLEGLGLSFKLFSCFKIVSQFLYVRDFLLKILVKMLGEIRIFVFPDNLARNLFVSSSEYRFLYKII